MAAPVLTIKFCGVDGTAPKQSNKWNNNNNNNNNSNNNSNNNNNTTEMSTRNSVEAHGSPSSICLSSCMSTCKLRMFLMCFSPFHITLSGSLLVERQLFETTLQFSEHLKCNNNTCKCRRTPLQNLDFSMGFWNLNRFIISILPGPELFI